MLPTNNRFLAAAIGAVLIVGVAGATLAQQASATGVPVAATLYGAQSLSPLAGGDLLVSNTAGGTLLRVKLDGTQTEILSGIPVSQAQVDGQLQTVGISAAIADGFGGYRYITGGSTEAGFSALYSVNSSSVSTLIADIGTYEELNNTDGGTDSQGNPELLSNPYDLVSDGAGGFYISDSSANTVFLVGALNNIRPFATFPDINNSLYPSQGDATIGQMPMGITLGPDGALYVATHAAFPHPTGKASVYRLKDVNGDDDALDAGESTVVVSGLTAAIDVAFNADGVLLVTENSTNLQTGATGRISQVVNGVATAQVLLLDSPTSTTITDAGRLFVLEGSPAAISDVTDEAPGGFGSTITSGVTLTTYGGGSVATLEAEAAEAGASSVTAAVSGKLLVLVVGAPSFVNTAFTNQYPGGVPAGTIFIVTAQ